MENLENAQPQKTWHDQKMMIPAIGCPPGNENAETKNFFAIVLEQFDPKDTQSPTPLKNG